jgi:predicted ATPase
VAGEAGIGKSALVHTFADGFAGDTPVLIAGCDDLSTPRALGPIRDLVERLPADQQAVLADDLSGSNLVRVLAAIGAEEGCVVVIEDLTGSTTPRSTWCASWPAVSASCPSSWC